MYAALIVCIALFALLSLSILALRLKAVLDTKRPKPQQNGSGSAPHLMIVLGSGGHTAEMIAMLERAFTEKDVGARLEWHRFAHRTWIISSGDTISAKRAKQFEDTVAGTAEKAGSKYDVKIVPRARQIHQSLYTTPLSSLQCLVACAGVLLNPQPKVQANFPDVILCNGPATATIMVATSIMLRLFNVRGCNSQGKMRTVYVESFARVQRLSLSGTLLSRVVDRFLVQWPQLESRGGRIEYIGVLV